MRRIQHLAICILLLSVLHSCKEPDNIVLSITVAPENAEITIGESINLTAIVSPTTNNDISWSSSDPAVATVTNDGVVTAVSQGSTTIVVACGDLSAICNVTVKAIQATKLTLSEHKLNIEKGGIAQLTTSILPVDATYQSPRWSSDDPEVAIVNQDGIVYALKAGSTMIRAEIDEVFDICQVNVTVPTSRIELNQPAVTINRGSTLQLSAHLFPEDASDNVTWVSSDNSVVTVDGTGRITGQQKGTAMVTVHAGNASASCEVTVVVAINKMRLNPSEILLSVGNNMDITLEIDPVDAMYGNVSWFSTNESVAEFQNGKVYGIGNGTAKIIAKVDSFEAECNVTVVTLVKGISMNITSATLRPTQTIQLEAIVHPAEASDKVVLWSSSNPDVAIVDSNGLVSAAKDINYGSATITAISNTGGYKATCQITVQGVAGGGHEGTGCEEWD